MNESAESTTAPQRLPMRFIEGMTVNGSDDKIGTLDDVIVTVADKQVTHLIVQHGSHHESARLIPVDAIGTCGDELTLTWSVAQFERVEPVETTESVAVGDTAHPRAGSAEGLSHTTVFAPFAYGVTGFGLGFLPFGHTGMNVTSTTYDRIPEGSAELDSNSEVVDDAGHVVGHVDGILVDANGHITDVLVRKGHLWTRHDISIPVGEVGTVMSDVIELK